MTEKTLVTQPPSGWLRFALRLPLVLYRLRLGWLLGGRFLRLYHVGRKSGQVRQTVVEVVHHEQTGDTYYIVSGWGYKAQWYQNLMVMPDVVIQVGSRRMAIRAETLPPERGADILIKYRTQHPMAAAELSRIMGIDMARTSPTSLIDIVRESLPVLALRPR